MALQIAIDMQEGSKVKRQKLLDEGKHNLEIQPKNHQVPNEEFIPRDYQSDILDRAKKENVIVCIGTGTGKTYIAVMLIKHLLHQTRNDYKGEGKRTVFLVPTVPLVRQQANVIRRHLPDAKVGEHFGEMTVELTNKEMWHKEIEDKNIFVMVAEEFRLLVHHAFIPLSKVNLIVIDECHRAVKNHPYREVMKCFNNCDNRPHVLGLTAPLVNTKCKPYKLEQHILSLERTLYSKVITAESSAAMKMYGTDPKECIATHLEYKNDNQIFTQVTNILRHGVTIFSKDFDHIECDDVIFYTQPRKCISNILHIATNLGPWCTFHSASVMLDEIHRIPRSENNESILANLEEILKVVCNLCERILKVNDSVYMFSSPKLKKLLDVLDHVNKYFVTNQSENCHGNIPSLCGIIFVRQRLSAYVLCSWLNAISENIKHYSFLKTNFVVGHGQQQQQISIPKLNSLTHKKQEKIIKDFQAKTYNFLISTSVLEEGIDVPKCNVVIRFDPPDDFRAYIQSKGRARAADAMYILMVSESEKLKFMESVSDFRQIQKILKTFCQGRQQPTEEDSLEANSYDEILPPYMPVKEDGSPRITMSSAVNLIYRYCSALPCDKSSQLLPKWETDKSQNYGISLGTICTLYLPLNSAVKEPVVSPVMQNKRCAKMAAALKMCEKLHKAGELDENLLPVGNKIDKYVTELLGDINYEISNGDSRKKQCLYEKEMPDILQQNLFEESEGRICFFLYSVEMNFAPNSDFTRLKEYEKIEGCHNFGILTAKPLPQLCTFPIFTSKSGLKINVNIDIACSDVYLDDLQLNNVLCFHQYMFSDVLQISKGRLLFNPEKSKFKILIAPIIKDDLSMKYYLDWVLISRICDHCCLGEEQLKERNRRLMKPDSYVGVLVYPWHYRNSKEKIYFYVKKVELDMTPESLFPDSEYSNYIEYFDKKYDVKVMKRDQFLLFVNPISASLSMEKSRYENQYGKPLLKQTKKAQQRSIRLPPELCIISPVPFSLYRKALSLPVVLYRMSGLLRAEQLRATVAKDVDVSLSNIGNDFKWLAFEFGEDYLKKSARSENTSLHFENIYKSVHRNLNLEAPSVIRMGSNFVSKINLDYQVPLQDHPGPSPGMLLTALTLRGANDGINLERLEVVGDSFLKYAISVFLYCTYKDLDEGKLTTLKSCLIRNSYLLHLGKKRELHRLIAAVKYEGRGNWIPPCYMVSCCEQQGSCNGKCSTKGKQNPFRYTKQRIPDKSIADCVEALIGAYLLSCGPYGALKFMSWLGMKVFNICVLDKPCLMFDNYPWLNYTIKDPCHISSNIKYRQFKAFQKKIGYTFKNEIYLLEAFTHATFNSFHHPYKTDCYQRLEFIGDALLDYIVMRYLYEDPKNHTPGILTDIRAALVNNHFFATLAAKYDYHKYICYDSASLFQMIDKFTEKATSEDIDVGQCSYDIEETETDDIAEIDVPKALADVFESVAGAIYIDSGMLLEEVWRVYYPMIKPGLENFCNNVPKPPVRQLFELFPQRIKFDAPKLLPSRMVQVKVTIKEGGEFIGMGPNKTVAKQAAAKRALLALQSHN